MHWYIRSKNEITGPFTTGQVQQFLLLGRVTLNDAVSPDREGWQPVSSLPELIPEVMKMDQNDEQVRERLAAARRWADERRSERRSDVAPNRIGPGRRQQESCTQLEERHHDEVVGQTLKHKNDRSYIGLIVVIILLSAGAWAGFRWVPQQTAGARGVDTNLNGAELSYTDSKQTNSRRCQYTNRETAGCRVDDCKPEECDLD